MEKKGEGPVERKNGQREALPARESVCSCQKMRASVLGAGLADKVERQEAEQAAGAGGEADHGFHVGV